MSESYFEITDQEWRSGSLAEDKLDQVQESFDSIGFAVVAGLVPPAICEQLMTAFLEDVELIREKAGLTPHEKHTAEGHLQLGPRRSARLMCVVRWLQTRYSKVLLQSCWDRVPGWASTMAM